MQHSVLDGGYAAITNVTTIATIVAAPGAGRRLVVLGFTLSLDAAGEATWSSASTALTGAMELVADTPLSAWSSAGVLLCAENEALRLTATTAANGFCRWITVNA